MAEGMQHENGELLGVLAAIREQQLRQNETNEYLVQRQEEFLNQMRGVIRDGEALEHRLGALERRADRGPGETRDTTPDAPLPARFGGEAASLRDFLHSVRNVFALQPRKYSTEEGKVRFCGALLDGPARAWFRSLYPPGQASDECTAHFEAFAAELANNFGDPRLGETAQRQLEEIRQAGRPVSTYAAEFRLLAADAGHSVATVLRLFRRGLDDRIATPLLYRRGRAEGLAELIQQSIDVESLIAERLPLRRFQPLVATPRAQAASSRGGTTPSGGSFQSRNGPSFSTTQSSSSGPSPMEVGVTRVSLSPQEREKRRREGRCFICNLTGHNMYQCPSTVKRLLAAMGVAPGDGEHGASAVTEVAGGVEDDLNQGWTGQPGVAEDGGGPDGISVGAWWDVDGASSISGQEQPLQLNY